jgi:hypothetical protein
MRQDFGFGCKTNKEAEHCLGIFGLLGPIALPIKLKLLTIESIKTPLLCSNFYRCCPLSLLL